jgi:hypothetical protein
VTEPASPSGPPADVSHLVRERAEARATRNWARADELKAQIEAAGWRVVDHGKRSSVHPATPPTLEVEGERRYGAASDVPSTAGEPPTARYTVVLVASEEPARISRLLAALRAHAPAGTQVVVVENDPSDAQVAALQPGGTDLFPIATREPEVLRTSARLGYAGALNIGLRRAAGEIVVVADGSAVPTGDALTPLAEALGDPEVSAAGAYGLLAEEGVPFRPSTMEPARPEEGADLAVAALEGAWIAFRRDDLTTPGLIDEHFVTPAWLDVWLSLRLRVGPMVIADDAPDDRIGQDGEGDDVEGVEAAAQPDSEGSTGTEDHTPEEAELPAPKRALMTHLPLERDATRWPPDRTRLNRRNMYRVLDAFGWRDDLA